MTHKNTHRKKIKINILGSGRHENLRATSKICGLHEQLSLLRQVTFLALKGYKGYCTYCSTAKDGYMNHDVVN